MKNAILWGKGLWRSQKGQGMAEYGLILALIAVVAIVALGRVGGGISGILTEICSSLGCS